MRTPTKIAGFAAGLALAFGAAAGIGQAAGPTLDVDETTDHSDMSSGTGHAADGHAETEPSNADHGDHGDEEGEVAAVALTPGGLMVSQDGYTLRLQQTTLAAGPDVPIALSVLDAVGAPVTEFEVKHAKQLHLIAVRRDATGYQHVHPVMDVDGTWRTELDLRPGQWRIFTDMAPSDGSPLTLGADLDVAGNYQPVAASGDRPEASIGGYTVSVEGDLIPGEEAELTLTVRRGGRPVTDLSPYLEAYGHLVALREGDLAYLHVHPDGDPGDGTTEPGPEVTFYAEVPSAGSYRLFFDFRHNGVVRTAPLALTAETSGTSSGADIDAPDGQGAPDAGGDRGDGDGGHSENRHSH